MKTATFVFDAGVKDLLPAHLRRSTGAVSFSGPQSAKHLIEALGIPHTEVGAVVVNGTPSGTSYLVCDGDRVEVFSVPPGTAQAEPRFIIDGHLGRLNSGLRMLGFDCEYRNDASDLELTNASLQDDRFLLTRDRRLLMRKVILKGYLVRSLDPPSQLKEVTLRFSLARWFRPFTRCIRCNHLLRSVEKQIVQDRLEPLTKLYFEDFRTCPSCKQIYWHGSHVAKMQRIVASLTAIVTHQCR